MAKTPPVATLTVAGLLDQRPATLSIARTPELTLIVPVKLETPLAVPLKVVHPPVRPVPVLLMLMTPEPVMMFATRLRLAKPATVRARVRVPDALTVVVEPN